VSLAITLNARLQPRHRGENYEDPLEAVLQREDTGSSVVGGGTLLGDHNEVVSCDIEVSLANDPQKGMRIVIDALERLGAPAGSTARLDGGEPVPFGLMHGVGLYLNGTDLPDEVYATSDVNVLVDTVSAAVGDAGLLESWYEGPRETAFYFYGRSAEVISERIASATAGQPLAERSRLVVLA
jgi:hypothetical protein